MDLVAAGTVANQLLFDQQTVAEMSLPRLVCLYTSAKHICSS